MAEENIFPNLENGELVAAMAEFKKEQSPKNQSDLVNAALKAKYFAPVEVMDGEGKVRCRYQRTQSSISSL